MKMFKKSLFLLVALFLAVFTLASCNNDEKILSELEEAAKKIVLTQDKQEVTGDFEVTAVVKVGENSYNVAWASDNAVAVVGAVKDNFIPITVDYLHNQAAATNVKLTATVSKEGSDVTFSKDFKFTVPQFKVNSIAEYDALNAKEAVTVHGVIVAKEAYGASYKNTSVYLASVDGVGGVYAYRLACTEEQYNNELKIGQKIFVSGKKYVYNGLREFDGGCTYILDTEAAVTPTVTDITSIVKDGSVKDKDLQNQLVKFENLEVISVSEKDDKGRFNIVCGTETNNITVRVNTYLTAKDSDAYKAYEALNLLPGMLIDVNGVAGYYNALQVHPLDADDIVVTGQNYGKVLAATLAGKIDNEDPIYGVTEITLPTTVEGDDFAGLTATWASDNAAVVVADGKATTALVENDTEVKLTVTVKKGEEVVATAEVVLTLISEDPNAAVPAYVKEVAVDTEYYLMLNQAKLGTDLFFAGEMSGYYLASVLNAASATKIKLEAVEGGYSISFMVDDAKKYINATLNTENNKVNIGLGDTSSTIWTWNEEYYTLTTVISDTEYYLGTYSTFNTFSLSNVSYAATSFVAHLYNATPFADQALADRELYVVMENPELETSTIYFNGEMKGYYGATVTNIAEAKTIKLEAVEGGYHVYFTNAEGAKTYINFELSGTYKNVKYEATAKSVWTWDVVNNTLVTTLGDDTETLYALGTSGTYGTISVTKVGADKVYLAKYYSAYVMSASNDAAKALYDLNKVVNSIETTVTQTTTTTLYTQFKSTLTVTPQANATTLAWDAENKKLTVTPGSAEASETVTIKVVAGEVTLEKTITITSKVDNSSLKATLAYTGTEPNTTVDGSNDATLVGLDADIFSVIREKNSVSGCALYTNSIRLYANAGEGNGSQITISGTGITIKGIKITFDTSKTGGSYSVNGTACTETIASGMSPVEITFDTATSSVVIKNISSTNIQVRIASIEITYSVNEA